MRIWVQYDVPRAFTAWCRVEIVLGPKELFALLMIVAFATWTIWAIAESRARRWKP